ncbi:hypothetical protein PUNSTDRAFT_126674 [Punctularia strigosozonata HHB-11173 SS5]|uniref:uncharacterized protein n=1 Tax=Punctularia strigosozonata (strain HHB-11173) TaxID=741275 RepID=UPI0004417F6B|nr:uncharacterized protein PUNSTDRAFT_126674 [Punctularia strigosozonata HHB-11173 SS5]EIN07714.1 hypothetical protein PUNSTDRAFT_126674 [Punctularia strigosozonata HHB-11173 SS5]
MDRSAHDTLYSRGPSTPDIASLDGTAAGSGPSVQPPHQRPSPTLSYREPAQSTSPSHLDALFHNLNQPGNGSQYAPASSVSQIVGAAIQQQQQQIPNNSAPTTPMSVASHSSAQSQSQTSADRQSALLSLLGSVAPAHPAGQPVPFPSQVPVQGGPQQIPTPPGSSQSHVQPSSSASNDQGRVLLEQLMGTVPAPQASPEHVQYGPHPLPQSQSQPHLQSPPQPQQQQQFFPSQGPEPEYFHAGNSEQASYAPPPHPFEMINSPHAQTHGLPPIGPMLPPAPQPGLTHQIAHQDLPPPQPSPPKSMFEFISPFDALASSGKKPAGGSKPLPVPTASQGPAAQGSPHGVQANQEERGLASWAMDPKRKSVENLMEQLTRGVPPSSSSSPQYDSYYNSEELTPVAQQPQNVGHGGQAPPAPLQILQKGVQSPRGSPPRAQQQQAPVQSQVRPLLQQQSSGRSVESPLGHAIGAPAPQGQSQGHRRERSSPVPGAKGGKGRGKQQPQSQLQGQQGRSYGSPESQGQQIVFDVSQPLDEIRASQDLVKSTAIALVKVDQNFLPGTTIGATHWVAYAMTKGRVRVISRSSGDRTLLQLPPTFPPSTVVNDMAVFGNRLAGVTSDGGFVVWELPEVVTDDALGRILLCVFPALDGEALHSVKWHPKQANTVAVASETKIYLINIEEAAHLFGGDPVPQNELQRVGDVFSIPSPLVAFDFDVLNYGLATISDDSVLRYWTIHDRASFWSAKIPGEDTPSSLILHDHGVILGRRKGTIYQLLPHVNKTVLSTIRFVNGARDDPEMFSHACYDSRIQTLWVANNRRDSMLACRLAFEPPAAFGSPEEQVGKAWVDQLVEFAGPKPTIHFVILTADADPTGEEAHAACVAAKVPPGELALVAFSVHSSGVDQVLIRREWYDNALVSTASKFPEYTPPPAVHPPPSYAQPPQPPAEPKQQPEGRSQRSAVPAPPPTTSGPSPRDYAREPVPAVQRPKTPPTDELDSELAREEPRQAEPKGKGKGKNVGWKEKESSGSGNDHGKDKGKAVEGTGITEGALGSALSKEIRKLEENLHTRLGRLVGKELDKQHQRMEEVRASEQAADFQRQEKILKLISTELTKNTTRVVEVAVKSEVQNSVLPSLENITRTEIKSALDGHVTKSLTDAIKQSLPAEVERLLLRSDVSNQIARNFASNITPAIERHVKDTVTKTLIPAYTQQFSQLHQDLTREMHAEMLSLKKDVLAWQTDAFRAQDTLVRDLEQSVRSLNDQVKYLSLNQGNKGSPSLSGNFNSPHTRPMPISNPPVSSYPSSTTHGPYIQQQPNLQQQPWFSQPIAAPQASHPAIPPPAVATAPQQVPRPVQNDEWDDTYLTVLGTQDPQQLRELLARSNPEVVMPLTGNGPLSQAVILTLVHRLSATIAETSPADESFKVTLWWLLRAANTLNPSHHMISPYVSRVLPNVQQMLNTTKQRLSILPGGSPVLNDTVRTISDVQEALGRSR